MSEGTSQFEDIRSLNEAVVEVCSQFFDSQLDIAKVYDVLTGKEKATDEQIYYAYFWFCWKTLYISYLDKGGRNLSLLPYTKKILNDDDVQLNKEFLLKYETRFLYFIVSALIEYLHLGTGIYAISADDRSWALINKVKGMLGEIDDIIYKCGYQRYHVMSLIPYLLNNSYNLFTLDELNKTAVKISERYNSIVKDPRWKEIEVFLNANNSLEEKIQKQENTVNEIKELESKLTNLKSEYNFSNLSKAFSNIRNIKKTELTQANISFYFMAILLLLTPLALLMYHVFGNTEKFEGFLKLFYILPITTFELVLLYFTRIFYINKNNIMAQLLQIDFRLTICEFIKSYVDDREMKNDDKETWKSFESLIFSPLQPKEDKIPSFLEGADSIAELLNKALKEK